MFKVAGGMMLKPFPMIHCAWSLTLPNLPLFKSSFVCTNLKLEHGLTEIHEICYENYAISDSCKLIIFNILHSVIPTRRLLKVVRRSDDDVITHDPVRMRIPDLT
jgi:hypothetical protein